MFVLSGLKQKLKSIFINVKFNVLKIPIRIWVISLSLILIMSYVLYFVIPKSLNFTYAKSSYCIGRLTLLPDLYKQSGETKFKIHVEGGPKIGNLYLFSNKICLTPIISPSGENISISYSLFGGPFFQSNYTVDVGSQPKASARFKQPLALAKPIEFNLDQPDKVFVYQLKIDGKTSKCKNESSMIKCDIKPLGLKQGNKYTYNLVRTFNNKDASNAADGSLSLLSPTSVIKSSVKADEVVYSKPKTFTFETDKKLIMARITLKKIDNDKLTKVDTTSIITGTTIEASIKNDLERESKYVLTLDEAEGKDGSLLEVPSIVNFRTSGGPAVANISIGTSGVDANAKVVVTFDQAISQTQDVSKFISVTGGSATISRIANNQIAIQLHNLPRCGAFSISVNKGLVSQYDLESKNTWSHSSRINCRVASSVIGYSVKGRPIIAYYYGTGSIKILFSGGIHGSERSGSYIMHDWISHLDGNAYKIPADRQVVIVPDVNPDGLATSSRYNANNVNIDRNFPAANWKADIDTSNGIVINGGGTSPLSEPETQALANITTALRPRLEVSFHAKGNLLGANQYGDSVNIANLYASGVGYKSMIGFAEETMGYSITGEYEEWAGEQYGTPAILIELPTLNGYFFGLHQTTLWKMVNI